jgi:hypothetical protein
MNTNTNPATQVATELAAEARDHLECLSAEGPWPTRKPSDALDALAITPTTGARVLLTYGGPTVEAVLETTRDELGVVRTTGRIEWAHGGETAVHILTGEQAADLWQAYGLENLVDEVRS